MDSYKQLKHQDGLKVTAENTTVSLLYLLESGLRQQRHSRNTSDLFCRTLEQRHKCSAGEHDQTCHMNVSSVRAL